MSHDDPYQYGSGLFSRIGDWLKKSKLVSTIGSVIAPVAGTIHPALGAAVTGATNLVKQKGYGVRIAGEGRAPAPISRNQVKCLIEGGGRLKLLKSGAVSLARLKKKYKDNPKNISPAQFRALLAGRGHWGKGKTIEFAPHAGKGVVIAGRGTKKGQRRKTKSDRKAYESYTPFEGEGVSLPGRGKARPATKKKYTL